MTQSNLAPPLRATPTMAGGAADPLDRQRIIYYTDQWNRLDDLHRGYNRQVEESVRMVAGQQWVVFHPVLNRYLDVSEWMSEDERRWRKRHSMNRLLSWFMLTHARATENPPIVTYLPGPDEMDAQLAEVMDVAYKTLWRELNMEDVIDRWIGWVLMAGRGHLLSTIDPMGGEMVEWRGQGKVPLILGGQQLVDPSTNQPQLVDAQGVPFDQQGQALAYMDAESGQLVETGDPHSEYEGSLAVDVVSPLQVRGSWGPQPWEKKRRHQVKLYLPPEEVFDRFGVEIEPDVRGGEARDVGEMERILFGSGFYGTADAKRMDPGNAAPNTDGYCEVLYTWEAPSHQEGYECSDENPGGGRFTAVTKHHVLYDGGRPVKFPTTSPVRTLEFVRIPGRPHGTTPLETMIPAQRAYNEGYARIGEHVNLCTNPIAVLDAQSGIKDGQWTNRPGTSFKLNRRPGVPAVDWVSPPQLGKDVYEYQAMLRQELEDLGNLAGTSGEAPTTDASGEMVKELRFNSDRFLGPTLRRAAVEIGRLVDDWRALLPLVWTMEKTISYAGEDNAARTMVCFPEMFERGKVNVVADAESMLPDSRGDRQRRVDSWYDRGLLGIPGSPDATARYYDMMPFPHLSRLAKPGRTDRTMAEQENAQLLQGVDPREIPVFEWYDHTVHLMVLEAFMKSPDFLKQPPPIQEGFVFHRMAHMQALQAAMMQAAVQQAAVQQLAAGPEQDQPSGGKPHGKSDPSSESTRPPLPEPPSDGPPGGTMPTVQAQPAPTA